MPTSLNHTALYAVQAALRLARQPERRCTAGELARALALPRNYLSKVLHVMTHAGLLESVRGPKGGFRLARAPGEITLADIAGPFVPHEAAPEWWRRAASHTSSYLENTTLQALVKSQTRDFSIGGRHGKQRRTR